ncbi:SAM-dependent methyltransferase [Streptomyces sanglieri]|uniref:SAM-dependent methyltransferase n=1 Tax=Streptomyces sanglieri TaxID=193460 RepID=UPI003525AB3F
MNAPAPAIDVDSPAEGTAPSTARITHWLLGGERHHQPADRRLGIRVLNAAPWTEAALEINRHYAHQTVEMLRGCGITQFVDLGSGLPTPNPRSPTPPCPPGRTPRSSTSTATRTSSPTGPNSWAAERHYS